LSETALLWDPEKVYVIGHLRPDTDAIASAAGYGWYLNATGRSEVVAARTGQPSAQTIFALHRFEIAPPILLPSVAPTFGHAARAQEGMAPEAPLAEVLNHFAAGARVVPVVDEAGRPVGVITPMVLARTLGGVGGAAALGRPCRESVLTAPIFAAEERLSDHRASILRSEADDLLVTGPGGRLIGLATRSRVLGPPRARLYLVDHNELSQAVAGAEEAEILGVLDHHRLGNPATAMPIPFVVEPVGSTSTLVTEQIRRAGLEPPRGLCGLLLSGILSDTLIFRSPTATDRDRSVAGWLQERAGVDCEEYGNELLRSGPGLRGREPQEVLDADRKQYRMGERDASIAQVETTGFQELPEVREALLEALGEQRRQESLALACLMVTDIVTGRSRLLACGDDRLLEMIPFTRSAEGEWDLGPIVSRKKQLVPALHDLLDETGIAL
jgi:manganese-dependent inorganic pyrophosphatase